MYKTQMKVQKLICLAAVVLAAVTFIYALGFMTDIYDSLYQAATIRTDKETGEMVVSREEVEGASIYLQMQGFNQKLLAGSIAMIIISLLLFLTNTNVRRRYYIGNYCAVGIYSVAAIAYTIFAHINIEAYKEQFLTTVNKEQLAEFAEMWGTLNLTNTHLFDLHYLVFGLLLVVVAGLIANVFWKQSLMKEEQALLQNRKGAKA